MDRRNGDVDGGGWSNFLQPLLQARGDTCVGTIKTRITNLKLCGNFQNIYCATIFGRVQQQPLKAETLAKPQINGSFPTLVDCTKTTPHAIVDVAKQLARVKSPHARVLVVASQAVQDIKMMTTWVSINITYSGPPQRQTLARDK